MRDTSLVGMLRITSLPSMQLRERRVRRAKAQRENKPLYFGCLSMRRSRVTAQLVCAQSCSVPCTAVLSSVGPMMEASLPCVSCATPSMSPGSCTGFQWDQPRYLFWDAGPCKQLGEEGNTFKQGEGSAQLLFSVNQSQTSPPVNPAIFSHVPWSATVTDRSAKHQNQFQPKPCSTTLRPPSVWQAQLSPAFLELQNQT